MEHALLVIGIFVVLIISAIVVWQWLSTNSKISNHPMLANIKYKRLAASSPTRQRLAKASELFAEGWKVLQSTEQDQRSRSLQLFAKAVEIDEMACGWKGHFEEKLEMVGDLFMVETTTSTTKEDIYHSMLAEAYFVLLLYVVVALYGKPSEDVEEDFRVIKSRLDECIKLQPRNPVVYKLRGDWCQRFSGHCDRDQCIQDFRKAISLAESDPDGNNIHTHGVEPQAQRNHLLAYSHFQLGNLLHRKKDFVASQYHYEEVIKVADTDFVQLPDTFFNLAVLAILNVGPEDNQGLAFATASRHYKSGCQSRKKLSRWISSKTSDVPMKLAKTLIAKFGKVAATAAKDEPQDAQDKKDN